MDVIAPDCGRLKLGADCNLVLVFPFCPYFPFFPFFPFVVLFLARNGLTHDFFLGTAIKVPEDDKRRIGCAEVERVRFVFIVSVMFLRFPKLVEGLCFFVFLTNYLPDAAPIFACGQIKNFHFIKDTSKEGAVSISGTIRMEHHYSVFTLIVVQMLHPDWGGLILPSLHSSLIRKNA